MVPQRPTTISRLFSLRPQSAVLGALIFLAAIYVANLIVGAVMGAPDWLATKMILIPSLVLHEPWRVLTTSLIHLELLQLMGTTLTLWFFAMPVEQQIGGRRTLIAMFGGATLAAIVVAVVGQLVWGTMVYAGYDSLAMAMLGAFAIVYSAVPLNIGVAQVRSTTLMGIFIAFRIASDIKYHNWLGIVGGLSAVLFGALLSGYSGQLASMFRGYRAKAATAKKRRGFVVIDGGRGAGQTPPAGPGQKPTEPRLWN